MLESCAEVSASIFLNCFENLFEAVIEAQLYKEAHNSMVLISTGAL